MKKWPDTPPPWWWEWKTMIESVIQRIKDYFFGGWKDKRNEPEEDFPNTPWGAWNSWRKNKKNKLMPSQPRDEIPIEDQESYLPKDMEFWESEWESSRFAVVYPFLRGKYATGKLSYFSPSTNLWSKKRNLQPLEHSLDAWKRKYTYGWCIVPWVNAIPLPTWALPDTKSLIVKWKDFPSFSIDQNGCVYLSSTEKMWVSFDFALKEIENIKHPIPEDGETMIFSSLSKETRLLLDKLKLEGMGD